jgi:hypothetical protein
MGALDGLNLFSALFFWTGFTGLSGFFILSHFPEGSEKTQSAFSGKLI